MATATPPSTLLTAEEFAERQDPGYPEELVRGKLIRLTWPGARHRQICSEVIGIFGDFVKENHLGRVLALTGIITERNPDTVRGADMSFYSYARLPKGPLPDAYLAIPADLIVEVRSHDDRWPQILAKVAEYLEAGVGVVCVFDDDTRSVQVYDPNGPARTFGEADFLEFPACLPGFRVEVRKFLD